MSEHERGREESVRLDTQALEQMLAAAKDLVRALEGTATSQVRLRAGGFELEVMRSGAVSAASSEAARLSGPGAVPQDTAAAGAGEVAVPGRVPVCAPLVGVFYRTPSPGARSFVEVGDRVDPGQVVGIIEAMKVMNQVTTDCGGTVAEILVNNGETVQYQQPLLLIDTTPAAG